MSKPPVKHHSKRSTRSTKNSNNQLNKTNINIKSIAKPQETHQRTSETPKRKADFSSPTSPETAHQAKKPTTTMSTLTIDDIQKLLDAHNNRITETIRSTVHSELLSFGEQLKADINNKIAEVNVKIDAVQANVNVQNDQLSSIQSSVTNCIERITVNEDDCNRIAKLNELKINGIPYNDGENLQSIFSSIAQQVGFDVSIPNNVPELNRVQTKKK